MFNTLRQKLLAVFLFFTFLTFGVLLLSVLYIRQKNSINQLCDSLNKTHILILQDAKVIQDFFTHETINPDFFETGESIYLIRHKQISAQIQQKIKHLQQNKDLAIFEIHHYLTQINSHAQNYPALFDSIVGKIQQRGFKDYGVEGEMRNFIHQIEKTQGLKLSTVLMLRRHEKDYIIRNQKKYIARLHKVANHFEKQIVQNPALSLQEKDSVRLWLQKYTQKFDEMVRLDRQIGIKDNSGLKRSLDSQNAKILSGFAQIMTQVEQKREKHYTQMKILFISVAAFIFLLSIVLSFVFARRMTWRLSILAKSIERFVKSGFTYTALLKPKDSNDEIGKLVLNYGVLKQEILTLINDFKAKVEQRTKEIVEQKNQIEQQNEEITVQRDELSRKNKLIEEQKTQVEQKNKDLIASIRYAKRIQEALLPNKQNFNAIFPHNFVLLIPKDIVSGDFYWLKQVKNQRFDINILAAVDCTGHGVPGALMSMLGVAFLNEIVERQNVQTAADMLNSLRENIIDHLQQQKNGRKTNDGMDIALFLIDNKTQKLQFSGANRPLFLLRDNEITEIKGDKMPIGKYTIKKERQFSNHEILLQKNDSLYLFSDGYVDQFGHTTGKKFMKKNFKKLLLNNADKPMPEQGEILKKTFSHWRGKTKQTDDVLVVGIKIS